MRADNKGEGGILALAALVARQQDAKARRGAPRDPIMLGLFGAALLYGDGVITPAISVLGASRASTVATDAFSTSSCRSRASSSSALFIVQKRGTGGIGIVFGPIMLLWFIASA